LLILVLAAISVSLYGNFAPYLKSTLQHNSCSLKGVDAVFVLKNNQEDRIEPITEQFTENCIKTSYNDILTSKSLSDDFIEKYCSQHISPELLAQIANHLSIYQYALTNKLSSILIVEATSTIKRNLQTIEIALEELSQQDSNWDILFVSTDYCLGQEGEEHLAPQIMKKGRLQPNKTPLSQNLSKLFYRYGCSSYLISCRGMKKILRFFHKHWLDLPLDQVLFQIPKLHSYTVNQDIIINGLYRKVPQQSPICYIERKIYPLGDEFWIDPYELLVSERFDIFVKYLYAKSYLENKELDKYEAYYLEQIKKWNNFYEGSPLKIGADAFLKSFQKLISNLHLNGFDPSAEPVPINTMGVILNGSHRVGACLALNIPVKVKVEGTIIQKTRKSFANKMDQYDGVSKNTIDQLVKDYVAFKANTSAIQCIHECADLDQKISQYVDIVYTYKDRNLYVIESANWNMVNKLVKSIENLQPHVFSHEETLSILHQ
jgi:hypothetical protein